MTLLNREQEAAVSAARRASLQPGRVVVLDGPAGTGKTTTLEEVTRALPGTVVLAPTNKAAAVARERTGAAGTIQRWLYAWTFDKRTGTWSKALRRPSELTRPDSGVIVVDEASMVGAGLWTDLRAAAHSIGCSVVLVGDGFQLPPVDPGAPPFSVFSRGFRSDERVTLKQVYRQAAGSPVLDAATALRTLRWSAGIASAKRALGVVRDGASDEVLRQRQQHGYVPVICHRNSTRRAVNTAIREALGCVSRDAPERGEPLLVRTNDPEAEVFKGEVVEFAGAGIPRRWQHRKIAQTSVGSCTRWCVPRAITASDDLPPWLAQRLWEEEQEPLFHAHLGYAITCHSAQGSQWPSVVVVLEESMQWMREEMRRRLLYTAITRAQQSASLVIT